MLDEVIYPNDVGVLHRGQELPLGHRGGHSIRVPGIQQPLQHHPAITDVAVARQVDPAQPPEGQAAEHLVLPGHQLAGRQLRGKGEPGAAVPAESLGQARPAVLPATDGLPAVAAEAPVLRHLRVGEHGAGRVTVRHRRNLDQPRSEPAAPTCRWCAGNPRRPKSGRWPPDPNPNPRPLSQPTPPRQPAPAPSRRPARRPCSTRLRSSRRS